MRKTPLAIIILLFSIPLALVGTLLLAIESHPRIDREVMLTPLQVERAKEIIHEHQFWVRPGGLGLARVTSIDVDIAANYIAHRFGNGSAKVSLSDGNAILHVSLPLREFPLDGYLNLKATLVETTGIPQLQSVHIGKLALADALTHMLWPQVLRWLQHNPEYQPAFDALQLVKISPDELRIIYRWKEGLLRDVPTAAIDKKDREQLFRYQSILAKKSRNHGPTVALAEVLPLLAQSALKHSPGNVAIVENRAAILVATSYVLGISLAKFLPEARDWPHPAPSAVTLDGRGDLAKHFMVSATIAAYADTALADVIGLYKEIEDSRTGSGFSFNDMAANRAGTRFGAKAVASEASARRIQQRIVSGLQDNDLMPRWSDLPEFLSESEFRQRFGGMDSPAYRKIMQEIEQRVENLDVLK